MPFPSDPLLTELLACLRLEASWTRERRLGAVFAEDVRCITADGIFVGPGWVTRVPRYPGLYTLAAVREGDQAALIFDHTDLVLGSTTRHAWAMSLRDGRVHRVETSSVALPTPASRRADPAVGSLAWLNGRFGLHVWRPTDDDDGLSLAAAVDRARTLISPLPELDVDEVLVNADLLVLPIGWIGCSGVLVERATGQVHILGSGFPAATHIWAWYRGFADGKRISTVRTPSS